MDDRAYAWSDEATDQSGKEPTQLDRSDRRSRHNVGRCDQSGLRAVQHPPQHSHRPASDITHYAALHHPRRRNPAALQVRMGFDADMRHPSAGHPGAGRQRRSARWLSPRNADRHPTTRLPQRTPRVRLPRTLAHLRPAITRPRVPGLPGPAGHGVQHPAPRESSRCCLRVLAIGPPVESKKVSRWRSPPAFPFPSTGVCASTPLPLRYTARVTTQPPIRLRHRVFIR
jgi:hypothetical protein